MKIRDTTLPLRLANNFEAFPNESNLVAIIESNKNSPRVLALNMNRHVADCLVETYNRYHTKD